MKKTKKTLTKEEFKRTLALAIAEHNIGMGMAGGIKPQTPLYHWFGLFPLYYLLSIYAAGLWVYAGPIMAKISYLAGASLVIWFILFALSHVGRDSLGNLGA